MTITYEIDTARDLVVMRASGVLTEADALDVIDRSITDTGGAAIHKDVLFIVDPQTSLNQIDGAVLQQIRDHIESWLKKYPRTPIKCAIVSGPVQNLLGELWSARTNIDPAIAANSRNFPTEAEALAWLRPPSAKS